MRGLAKLLAYSEEVLAGFFIGLLPEILRLIVLAICMLWKNCKHITSSYKYTSAINKKSSNFAYHTKSNPNSKECCTICLSEFERGDEAKELVDCRHIFHRSCVERWLRCQRAATCPLCRSVVVPEAIVAEYHRTRVEREGDGIRKEIALILLKVLHGGSCRHGFF